MTRSTKIYTLVKQDIAEPSAQMTLTTLGLWQRFKSAMQSLIDRAGDKSATQALAKTPILKPDLLQCHEPQRHLMDEWRRRLPPAFALWCVTDAVTELEVQAVQLACQKNDLQVVCLSNKPWSTELASSVQVYDAAGLTLADWLALHHLASVLLQPVEIQAKHLRITLSAADVFTKPAMQTLASHSTRAATDSMPAVCTVSAWTHPDLPQLLMQLRDHVKVIAHSACSSQQRLREIMQAETVSANYQRWYGDILTGKHVAP